jgi:hypothetical protein
VAAPAELPLTVVVLLTVVPTAAIEGALLLHVPPRDADESTAEPVKQIDVKPVMDAGIADTVIAFVTEQLPNEYVITVVPEAMPVTVPDASTEPAAGKLLDHVPTPVLLSEMLLPVHTASGPVIAAGGATTVIVVSDVHPAAVV